MGTFCFSRRRRHTRFSRDWSSDVCSSDLAGLRAADRLVAPTAAMLAELRRLYGPLPASRVISNGRAALPESKIGRASCREREWMHDVAVQVGPPWCLAAEVETTIKAKLQW